VGVVENVGVVDGGRETDAVGVREELPDAERDNEADAVTLGAGVVDADWVGLKVRVLEYVAEYDAVFVREGVAVVVHVTDLEDVGEATAEGKGRSELAGEKTFVEPPVPNWPNAA
jgi:hypothetical protein